MILPGALPEILTGLRIGLGVGWSTLVAAEQIADPDFEGYCHCMLYYKEK